MLEEAGERQAEVTVRLPAVPSLSSLDCSAALVAFKQRRFAEVRTLLRDSPASDVAAQLLLRRATLEERLQRRGALAEESRDKVPLAALQRLLAQLAQRKETAEQEPQALLLGVTAALAKGGQAAQDLLWGTDGHAVLARYMAPPTLAAAASALRAGGPLSVQAAARLAASAAARQSPPESAAAAIDVLASATRAPGDAGIAMRLLALTPAGQTNGPLRWLAGLAAFGGIAGHWAANCQLADVFSSFATDTASRAALREAQVAPVAALLALERSHRDTPAGSDPQDVRVRRAALRALSVLCTDPWLVREEAFIRTAKSKGVVTMTPTNVLADLLDALCAALDTCAHRPAPVLGWDGRHKSFASAPFAADNGAESSRDCSSDSCLAAALDALRAAMACSPRSCARVLYNRGCIEALGPVMTGFDASTPLSAACRRDAELLAGAICAGCASAADTLCTGDDVAPLAGVLSLTMKPPSGLDDLSAVATRACERLAVLIPTCSGDAMWNCLLAAPHGAVQALHIALCKDMAADAAPRKDGAWQSDARAVCFLACVDRCRAARNWSGYFHNIGQPEVLRIEHLLRGGEAIEQPSPQPPPSPQLPPPPAAAAGAAPPSPPSAPAPRQPALPREGGSGEKAATPSAAPAPATVTAASKPAAVPVKRLPWDPPTIVATAQGARTAPACPPLIKKGFMATPTQRRTRPTAAVVAVQIAGESMASAAAAKLQAPAQAVVPVSDAYDYPAVTDMLASPPPPSAADHGGFDEDGCRIVWDSAGLGAVGAVTRASRSAWLALDLRAKLSWHQDSGAVHVAVAVPAGTVARDVTVTVTPTRLTVSLAWHGRVMDGPLARRCKASESVWSVGSCVVGGVKMGEVQVLLPKDDPTFWKALFEGGEEKSHYEVLSELVNADEATPALEEVDAHTRDLWEDLQEQQRMIAEGLIDPVHGFDDFRLVIGDGDGGK